MIAVLVLRSTEDMISFSVDQKGTERQNMATLNFPSRPSWRPPIPDRLRPDRELAGLTGAPSALSEETAEPIFDVWNRGVLVAGIAARESVTAKRSRREMAPQRLEKIESAPGNGMVSVASNPQDVVCGRAAGRARLRLTSRNVGASPSPCLHDKSGSPGSGAAMLQKKAPNTLKSLDAELK
jgi:hypothetical protein